MSAEYDKIMGLFEFTHRVFDRLSMIEQKVPKVLPFQRCVMRVFSSILKIFSVAQTYASQRMISELSNKSTQIGFI